MKNKIVKEIEVAQVNSTLLDEANQLKTKERGERRKDYFCKIIFGHEVKSFMTVIVRWSAIIVEMNFKPTLSVF